MFSVFYYIGKSEKLNSIQLPESLKSHEHFLNVKNKTWRACILLFPFHYYDFSTS